MSTLIKTYKLLVTGKQLTLIIAALVRSELPGSKELAQKLLSRASK